MGYIIYDTSTGKMAYGTGYYSSVQEADEKFQELLENDDLPDGRYTIAYEV